jgi:hypothetical protein
MSSLKHYPKVTGSPFNKEVYEDIRTRLVSCEEHSALLNLSAQRVRERLQCKTISYREFVTAVGSLSSAFQKIGKIYSLISDLSLMEDSIGHDTGLRPTRVRKKK